VQVPVKNVTITVRACIPGEIAPIAVLCQACPTAQYSFNPSDTTCSLCPDKATCHGGATLVPTEGYWHSAADSNYIVLCPNSEACQGNRSKLLDCQNAHYSFLGGSKQVQVHSLYSCANMACLSVPLAGWGFGSGLGSGSGWCWDWSRGHGWG